MAVDHESERYLLQARSNRGYLLGTKFVGINGKDWFISGGNDHPRIAGDVSANRRDFGVSDENMKKARLHYGRGFPRIGELQFKLKLSFIWARRHYHQRVWGHAWSLNQIGPLIRTKIIFGDLVGVPRSGGALNGLARLNETENPNDEHHEERYTFNDKAIILTAVCLAVGSLILVYKPLWKIRFDLSVDINIARYAAAVVIWLAIAFAGMCIAAWRILLAHGGW